MTSQSTPGDIFADLLRYNTPSALAWVRGGEAAPALSGLVKFYETPYQGVLVEAEIFNLPNKSAPGSSDFYAFHIHQNGDCSGNFAHTGDHYNPSGQPHPFHAGDFPPLLGNEGYAWTAFYDKRFSIKDIAGRSVIIHSHTDDFTSQPSGDSGSKIACGVIEIMH
ncbi:MAG: superoxide dismutase family protein [Clostridium sp.]|nr:superoxide dismutase family protein [Clostridium sp.]